VSILIVTATVAFRVAVLRRVLHRCQLIVGANVRPFGIRCTFFAEKYGARGDLEQLFGIFE
jgi:hypothetical protein